MKKIIISLALSVLTAGVFAAVPRTNNHGFSLSDKNDSKTVVEAKAAAPVVEEQPATTTVAKKSAKKNATKRSVAKPTETTETTTASAAPSGEVKSAKEVKTEIKAAKKELKGIKQSQGETATKVLNYINIAVMLGWIATFLLDIYPLAITLSVLSIGLDIATLCVRKDHKWLSIVTLILGIGLFVSSVIAASSAAVTAAVL